MLVASCVPAMRRIIPLAIVLGSYAFGLEVRITLNAPTAAKRVSRSLLSFSIEQDRWPEWVGTTTRNEFFFNVLDNLRQLTGEPPQIRIGANSEDHTTFDPKVQFVQQTFPAPTFTVPYPEASNITVGDGFYQTAQFLPEGTHVIWGVNLGGNDIASAFLQARSILKAFASSAVRRANIVLDAIQIGNEPDLYANNGLRSKSFNPQQYVKEWIAFATNISVAFQITPSSPTQFWGAGFAGSSHSNSGFSPQSIFNNGILDSDAGAAISTISQHRYSGSFCTGNGGLIQDLMTKSTIRSNLSSFLPDIAVVRGHGLDYLLGETNSYACHGAPGVSNAAGAALWTLDYTLFATQIDILRLYIHQGIGFKYNLIQPATLTRSILDGSPLPAPLPPHVQPQYYAAIIIAEALGNSGNTLISEISINHAQVAGYAFYYGDRKTLRNVVLINSKAYLKGNSNPRPTIHINLALQGGTTVSTSFKIKRLAIGHADDATGLSWGGQTYETKSGRVAGQLKVEQGTLWDGLNISATEVVLLHFS